MRSYLQSTGWSGQVQDFVAGLLQEYLPLRSFGRCCPVATQLAVLLFAAVRRVSLSAACELLRDAPSDETMRQALHAWLPNIDQLERQLNAACWHRLPKALRQRQRMWAIDLVELPYYGRPWQEAREVRSGKPKQGTSRFHAYASLYVVHRGERFTLALTYVWAGEPLADVVERLLNRAENRGIFPKFLLLDRQFYSLDAVARLKRRGTPFLLPVVHRGRKPKDPSRARGTRRFLTWKRSGFSEHLLRHGNRTAKVRIAVAVDHPPSCPPRRRVLVFALWGLHARSPAWVRETYRRRFGIETSYRQMHEALARTSTRRPDVRLLLVGIALLLRNVWVWLHRTLLARPLPHDAFRLHLSLLPFAMLLTHLQERIIALLGLANLPLPDT